MTPVILGRWGVEGEEGESGRVGGGGGVGGVEEATGMGQQFVDKGTELFHM